MAELQDFLNDLNARGCEQGRLRARTIETMGKKVDCLEKKIDRMTWALVSTAIGFAVSAVFLALNLLL